MEDSPLHKVAFALVLLFVLVASNIERSAFGANMLPPESDVKGYVDNMIQSYNALIGAGAESPSFSDVEEYYSLYHAVGNTFKVIVMADAPNKTNITVMYFLAWGGNDPVVVMDSNHVASQGGIDFSAYDSVERISFEYNNTIFYPNLIWSVPTSDITGDYATNSKNAAQKVYSLDAKNVPAAATFTAQTQGPPVPSGSFATNPIVQDIVAIFGSLIGFVIVIILILVAVFRKRVIREIKATFHLERRD